MKASKLTFLISEPSGEKAKIKEDLKNGSDYKVAKVRNRVVRPAGSSGQKETGSMLLLPNGKKRRKGGTGTS